MGAVLVSYNGEKKRFPRWAKWADGLEVQWERAKWTDDFAVARTHALSMVKKRSNEFGWWLWLDTDDVLVAPDGLGPIFDSLDEYSKGVFLRYAYAIEPKSGTVVVEQWRERLLAVDWHWGWRYPIHEVCAAPAGTQFAWREDAYIAHQRKQGDERGTRDRNRRIIVRAMKEDPEEPRHIYYFANEILVEASTEKDPTIREQLVEAGIAQYRKFLDIQTARAPVDDIYSAATRIGELNMMKGANSDAIDAFLQAMKFNPGWPDAYVGIARACMEMGDWPRMRDFAGIALSLPKPVTAAAIEPLNANFVPLLLRGIAREEMGELDDALVDYREAEKYYSPSDGEIQTRIKQLEDKRDKSQNVVDPWKERKRFRGKKREKSIAFFTNPIVETWNPKTLAEGGHGGAETMVMELAPRFAADGWRTVVFGTPGSFRGYDNDTGVEYWNSDEWLPNEGFRVVVASRAANIFQAPVEADVTFLWMHDVNVGPSLVEGDPPLWARPDRVVALTPWHAHHLRALYGIDESKMIVIPNGIDLSLYPERTEWSDSPKFIYSSSPDRGLDTLLGMWPAIRSMMPEATLDIFYGWEIIDRLISLGAAPPAIVGLRQKLTGVLERRPEGVTFHGRVPPTELAKRTYEAELWAYPTQFMETFCLTAIQMQAAGVLPLCTNLAGLSDTVRMPWLKVDGWPGNVDFQNRFLDSLAKLCSDEEDARLVREQARRMGRKHAEQYSIERVYGIWNDEIAKLGVRTSSG